MTPCPDETQLALQAEGGLDAAARAALERHLDGCAACASVVRELGALIAPVGGPSRYRLERRLGEGAMGVVWEAFDRELERPVALKWIQVVGDGDDERRARLVREARVLARLRHPNVVAVHDAGIEGDEVWVALELVRGQTARAWLAAAPRSSAEILALWRAVAGGLAAAHVAGVIHRDVKPDNVLVRDDGEAVLVDFGLASAPVGAVDALTRTGEVVGTPAYMAPEQLRGDAVDARADQFAWSACVWEALTGRRPFTGASVAALAVAMTRPPTVPAGADAPVLRVLARGLAHEPTRRWPDLPALIAALDGAARGRGRRRRGLIAAALAGALAVTAVTATLALSGGGARSAPRPPTPSVEPASITAAPVARPPRRFVDEATDRLVELDGAGCLRILDAHAPVAPALVDEVESLRALCEMRAGDCDGGRARLTRLFEARRPPAVAARAVDAQDAAQCPLAAPAATPAQRAQRLVTQLIVLTARHQSCRPLLAEEARLGVELDAFQRRAVAFQRALCHAIDGDCAQARASWRAAATAALPAGAVPGPAWRAGVELDFDRSAPTCAGR
ncbi:MAG: protein kinase [Myxococcales bacterium]|nr:protein kinase [Myxococcales bacterium]